MNLLQDQPLPEIVAFGRVLYDAAVLGNVVPVFEYFERPDKWEREYTAWVELGKPIYDSSGTFNKTWMDFLDALDELESS